jgi:peptidoglycan/xylan/chitin deacetylase (PgdA/CDA1 family)
MLKANEMGRIPVLMYHGIRQSIVPPKRLREDIALLKAAGFYPTTIREMAEGRMEIPAGKSPVVLTFDDSSPTHYRILDDGRLDPDCAVAILQAAVAAGDWAFKASFFPLLYVDPPANIVFGQPAYAEEKLRNLVKWGYEVGSHTVTHQDLSKATPSRIKKELAQSKSRLEAMIGGGYKIYTLNPPYGEYPDDASILASGEYDGTTYRYSAVVMAWGESGPSPFSSRFDPMHISRITAYPQNTVRNLIEYFRSHPELRYVSDGDPSAISVPGSLPAGLGTLRGALEQRVVRY